MKRRQFISLLGSAALLSGCGGETASVRFRVIARVTVDGEPVEGSTVMEVKYSRVTNSLIGAGGATTLWGEALVLDLKGKGTVYVLPYEHQDHTSLTIIYEPGVLSSLGIKNSIGGLEDNDFLRLESASGRMPFDHFSRLPAFVSFRDEKIPNTIYEVEPRNMEQYFPGVHFVGLDIEITKDPVTQVLKTRLPWLVSPYSKVAWDRDKPGHLRPDKDKPLGYKIVYEFFFGNGSW